MVAIGDTAQPLSPGVGLCQSYSQFRPVRHVLRRNFGRKILIPVGDELFYSPDGTTGRVTFIGVVVSGIASLVAPTKLINIGPG